VLPQLYAMPFMEVQLAATIRSTACDDQGSLGCLRAELSGGFDKLYPEPALFALAARLFDLQSTAVLMTVLVLADAEFDSERNHQHVRH
jgi:hypothetical protein